MLDTSTTLAIFTIITSTYDFEQLYTSIYRPIIVIIFKEVDIIVVNNERISLQIISFIFIQLFISDPHKHLSLHSRMVRFISTLRTSLEMFVRYLVFLVLVLDLVFSHFDNPDHVVVRVDRIWHGFRMIAIILIWNNVLTFMFSFK